MTKQEQSEKIIYGSLITSTKCYNCIHFPLCFAQKSGVNLGLASENDCCYYQSKLPEDSVVISKEEYESLKADNNKYVKDCIDYIATINKLENRVWEVEQQSSKETAEKFAKLIEFHSISKRDESGYETVTISNLCMREILREKFGFTNEELETMWDIKE